MRIKWNERVFNSKKQWYESKVKHLIWYDPTLYAKIVWERVMKNVKINDFILKISFRISILRGVLGIVCINVTI